MFSLKTKKRKKKRITQRNPKFSGSCCVLLFWVLLAFLPEEFTPCWSDAGKKNRYIKINRADGAAIKVIKCGGEVQVKALVKCSLALLRHATHVSHSHPGQTHTWAVSQFRGLGPLKGGYIITLREGLSLVKGH